MVAAAASAGAAGAAGSAGAAGAAGAAVAAAAGWHAAKAKLTINKKLNIFRLFGVVINILTSPYL